MRERDSAARLPDHAKLWITTHQLGRRNLTDDQRAIVANDAREIRSEIEKKERASKGGLTKARVLTADSTVSRNKRTTAAKVSKESKLPERKIRLAQEIKKGDPAVSAMVRAGDISLLEGRKVASLPTTVRQAASPHDF